MPKITLTFDVDSEALYRQRLLLAYLGEHDKSGIVDGLLQLTDHIADACADEGFKEVLMTGTKEEHKKGRRMVANLMSQILNGYVDRQN